MREVVEAIGAAIPDSQITYAEQPLALPDGTEDVELVKAIGKVPLTPLADGIASTITHFKQALADNKVNLDQLKN
jgi:hypothetical protein